MVSFLLSLTPPPLVPWAHELLLALAAASLGSSLVLPMVLKRRQVPVFSAAPWRRLGHLIATNSAILFALLFFRVEGIPFLSARFWIVLLALGDVAWLAFIIRHFLVRVPKQRRAMEEQQVKEKYLR